MGFRQIVSEDRGAHMQVGSEVREAEMDSPVDSQEDLKEAVSERGNGLPFLLVSGWVAQERGKASGGLRGSLSYFPHFLPSI